MLLAVDVDYRADGSAVAAGILFADWRSGTVADTVIRRIPKAAPYRPGHFFERELPCILAVVEALPVRPEALVIDGNVTLGADRRDGLGAHLFRALGGTIPVIGVAKSAFRDTPPETAIRRGGSRQPLYVTSAGLAADVARTLILEMHGPHRIPTILAAADRACRAG